MTKKEEVESFLKDFHQKMKIFGIIYEDDRDKNLETLKKLELPPSFRTKIIEKLKTEDYVQGPLEDKAFNISDMWVFGKKYKNNELYIKIKIGFRNSTTICVSFHIAEHIFTYPFKKKGAKR